jgi:hypothetical protein
MPDHFDTLVQRALPAIRRSTARPESEKALSSYFPLETDPDHSPVRVQWTGSRQVVPPWLTRWDQYAIEQAYDFVDSLELDSAELDPLSPATLRRVVAFASGARERERRCILATLQEERPSYGPLTLDSLRGAADELEGTCRFLGESSTADEAKSEGVIDECVAWPGRLPAPMTGILVRLDRGVRVRKLVDTDLTLTWSRISVRRVAIQLGSRFFLDDPDQVRWFEKP